MADVNSTTTQNQTQQQADDAFFHVFSSQFCSFAFQIHQIHYTEQSRAWQVALAAALLKNGKEGAKSTPQHLTLRSADIGHGHCRNMV